jgi:hypothetical protein
VPRPTPRPMPRATAVPTPTPTPIPGNDWEGWSGFLKGNPNLEFYISIDIFWFRYKLWAKISGLYNSEKVFLPAKSEFKHESSMWFTFVYDRLDELDWTNWLVSSDCAMQ